MYQHCGVDGLGHRKKPKSPVSILLGSWFLDVNACEVEMDTMEAL